MKTNPYQFTQLESQPQQGRASLLLTRVLWFAIGAVVACGIWSMVSFIQRGPRDYTSEWPPELRSEAPGWRKNALGRNLGQFTVIAAAEPNKASAEITSRPTRFPGVLFEDEDSDGRVDEILVADAKHRAISILVADGEFRSYSYAADAISGDWKTNTIRGTDIGAEKGDGTECSEDGAMESTEN